jgi:Acetyltransferase (GNAT) domain
MKVDILDPLVDRRWDELVATHPSASAFHTRGWLKALARTYNYRPVVLTSTAANQHLADGVVLCEVTSWLTGPRLVSLPFSDHAQPLLRAGHATQRVEQWLQAACARDGWKYVELRPISWAMTADSPLSESHSFWLHLLDLTQPLELIYHNLHRSCMQRRIRHAELERLEYERTSSPEILADFYNLLMMTRRRHLMIPQPRLWFQNLLSEMRPNAEIRMARKDGVPIAAILTLRHRGTMIYKYGCSNDKQHHLAGMPFLFWKLIEESKAEGVDLIDFGRTDLGNAGLLEFKDHLGAKRNRITYLRYPQLGETKSGLDSVHVRPERKFFSVLPNVVSSNVSRLIYRHFG